MTLFLLDVVDFPLGQILARDSSEVTSSAALRRAARVARLQVKYNYLTAQLSSVISKGSLLAVAGSTAR